MFYFQMKAIMFNVLLKSNDIKCCCMILNDNIRILDVILIKNKVLSVKRSLFPNNNINVN